MKSQYEQLMYEIIKIKLDKNEIKKLHLSKHERAQYEKIE